MKSVAGKGDKAVSEIIGFILIFAISVSFITSLIAWYVPATGVSNDNNFQAAEQSSFASLISQLESGGISPGTQISQNIQMGVPGEFLNPSTPTQLSFSNSGFSMNVSYNLQLGYSFLSNKEPTAISNVLFSTIPGISGRGPINSVFVKGNIFVTDFSSNSVSVINASTGNLVTQIYAGIEPYGITYDNYNNNLYVSDFHTFYNSLYNRNYSTVTMINASTFKVVDTINLNGTDTYLDNPTGIAYDGQSQSPNYGDVYVAGFEHIMYNKTKGATKIPYYAPYLVVINPVDNTPVCNISVMPESGSSYSLTPFATDVFVYNYSNPQIGSVLVTNYVNNSIFVVPDYKNTASYYYVTGTHDFANPIGITINPNNGLIFVVNNADNSTNTPLNTNQHFLPITPGAVNRPFTTVPPQQQRQNQTFNITGNITEMSFSNGKLNVTDVLNVPLHNPIGISYSNKYLYVTDNAGYYNNSSQYSYSELTVVNASNPSQNYTVNANGSLKTLLNPYSINFVPALNKFVITLNGTNSIAIFNNGANASSNFSMARFIAGSKFYFTGELNEPESVAESGNYLFIANRLSDKVSVYDTITGAVTQTITAGINPDALCFVSKLGTTAGTLYVANNGSNNLSIFSFNGATLSYSHSLFLGNNSSPDGMSFDSVNNWLYIADYGNSKISLLNVTTVKLFHNVSLPSGSDPIAVSYAPGTDFALVSDYNNSTVTLLKGSSLNCSLKVQERPDAIAYDTQTKFWYVTNFFTSNLSVIGFKSNSLSVLSVLRVGTGPDGVTYDPYNGYIYVSNFYSDNITLYNAPFNSIVDSIAIGGGPIGTAFDAANGFIYTPDYGTNQVSVVEGGTVFYNANGSGENLVKSYVSDGYFSSFTYTDFANPIDYFVEGGNLICYNAVTNRSNALLSLPISIVGSPSSPVVRLTTVSILGNNTSLSQAASTQLKLSALRTSSINYYPGERILYEDFYNNSYFADITSINLSKLTISLTSSQVGAWNSMFYSIFNKSTNGLSTPDSWQFSNYPFSVTVSGNTLVISEIGNSFRLNSASIVDYVFSLEAL